MKKFHAAHLFIARWALIALLVTSVPAFAQTTIWIDATGDWFTPANWSAGVPDSSTTAQINNGGTAQIMASGAAASLVELGVAAGDVGTLSVSGTGSLVDGGAMNVGENGAGTLNITKGGTVSDSDAVVGSGSGSTGTVSVDGPGSTWSHDGAITVAVDANGTGTVFISNGGSMTTGVNGSGSVIGHGPKSSGTVNVTGAGSTWINKASLTLSDAGGLGELDITDGGVVSSGDCIAGTLNGHGNVVVDGVGSTWTISGDLSVGDVSGGNGEMTITQGGQVTCANGFIGDGSGSTGTVEVAGANATWGNSGNLYVGGDASGAVGSGELHLVNNGTVSAAAITVWSTGLMKGKGFVKAAGVTNDGTLAPNEIMSMSGNLTFDSTAIMSSSGTPDTADEVMVGGTAGLDGTLNVTLTGGPFIVGMQYTLLTATGGLNGTTFANVSITAPAGVTAQVTYDTNDVFLTIKSSGSPTPTPSPSPTPTPTPTATLTPSPTPRQTPTPRFVPTPRPRPTPPPRP
jgi:T5SS/PEP-CTERM-associated repeat protein